MRAFPPEFRRVRLGVARTAEGCETSAPSDAGGDGRAFDEAADLMRERQQLLQAMESRPIIDMARGVLMTTFACGSDDAWEILVRVSQHANVKLRVVAAAVTEAASSGKPVPADFQEHLAAAARDLRLEHER
ncbi:ANTAR domain-containing protein [Streptomyces sp. NPDC010273]|uniref:ANTAR domain-containing protein n=1 Tax=Streptomyces sp. NPDC010273 TaxID=3364829 RepID=UPI0036E6D4EB